VRCGYCHVQREGQTFEQINFALDENQERVKLARCCEWSARSTAIILRA
jgi:hypothetical protein